MLPLTILFWIDAASLRSKRYAETVRHYHDLLYANGNWSPLPRPCAYIRLSDAEKPLLGDCIDELYDRDILPIVEDGTQIKQRRHQSDLLHVLDRKEIQAQPYLLHVCGDTKIQPAPAAPPLLQILATAAMTLSENYQVVSISFPGPFTFSEKKVGEVYSAATRVRYPAVMRSRDAYISAYLSRDQPMQQENLLAALSGYPTRHLCFNTSVVSSI